MTNKDFYRERIEEIRDEIDSLEDQLEEYYSQLEMEEEHELLPKCGRANSFGLTEKAYLYVVDMLLKHSKPVLAIERFSKE